MPTEAKTYPVLQKVSLRLRGCSSIILVLGGEEARGQTHHASFWPEITSLSREQGGAVYVTAPPWELNLAR